MTERSAARRLPSPGSGAQLSGVNHPPYDPIRPRALRPGARIALVAPAGPIDPEKLSLAHARCRSLGVEPVVFPHALAKTGYLAGTDAERIQDLQAAFDDPSIDAVWALRGGYGTLRILNQLRLDRQRSSPIPVIGFSDNTTLHVRHARMGVISFHGPHPAGELPEPTAEFLRRVLFRAEAPGPLVTRPEDPEPRALLEGCVTAPLFGGNLAMLASLCGSEDQPNARGRILFLEEVGEPAYRIDRMLTQLKRSGAVEGAVGLALGRFTDVPAADHQCVADVLAGFAQELGVPAVADLPFGHVDHNSVLPLGVRAELDAGAGTLHLVEPAVSD